MIFQVSEALEKRLGYEENTLAGQNLTTLYPHINLLEWKILCRGLEKKGQCERRQTELIDNQGLLFPFLLQAERVRSTEKDFILIMAQDLLSSTPTHTNSTTPFSESSWGWWQWDLFSDTFRVKGYQKSPLFPAAFGEGVAAETFCEYLRQVASPSSVAHFREKLKACEEEGHPLDWEFELEGPATGQSKQHFARLHMRGELLRSSLEQPLAVRGHWKAIPIEEEDQPASNALLEFSLEKIPKMVFWVKPDGNIAYVNEAVCHLLQYSRAELLRMQSEEIAPDLTEEARQSLWEKLRGEKQLHHKIRLKTRSGHFFPIQSKLYYFRQGDQEFSCVFSTDVTDHQAQEMQLSLAQETLDNLKDLVLWTDEGGKIQFINQAALDLLEYTEAEMLQQHLRKIYRGKKKLSALADQKELEIEWINARGEILPVEISHNTLAFGPKVMHCFVARDIRKQKKRLAELETAKAKVDHLSAKLKQENLVLREEVASRYNFKNIISESPSYKKVLFQAEQVAQTNATVLITGETGTGKELLARAIHAMSRRNEEVLVKVNCAALPENLIESELFGHVKGAFTTAIKDKVGRFEMADGGTLFLDEIGELKLDLQSKLLRALQEGEFERVGGTQTHSVDVRVIAATNRNLEEQVAAGKFREDLYYRLNVFPIHNPPLRERKEDIPVLVRHFVNKYSKQAGKNITRIGKQDLEELKRYPFPGNIRELENMIERAVILTRGKKINLRESIQKQAKSRTKNGSSTFPSFEEIQRDHILKALEQTGWRISGPHGAGRLLKMNDRTLASKMRKLGIQRKNFQSDQ